MTKRSDLAQATASENETPAPDERLALASVATVWDRLRETAGESDETADAGNGKSRRHAAPFVKWAGGKRSLLNAIGERLPEGIENYYEPMVGGGALFFALADAGLIRGRAVLIDSVGDLITTYKVVRDQVEDLIVALDVMAKRHMQDQEAKITGAGHYYYQVRDRGIPDESNELAVAARFIYLNRTCFNGLYRVNAKGRFNVPMGRYKNPRIVDSAGLRAASRVLNATQAILIAVDFNVLDPRPILSDAALDMSPAVGPDGQPLVFDGADELLAYLNEIDSDTPKSSADDQDVPLADPELEAARAIIPAPSQGDFVYFDPPYIPLVKGSFTRYTVPKFNLADQERLRDLVLRLTDLGVAVMASNSKTPEALDLYDDARLRVATVEAPRPVNAQVEGRGPVEEILVTNYGAETSQAL